MLASRNAVRVSQTPAARGTRCVVVHSAHTPSNAEVPPNVREARAWIAAWQSKQLHAITDNHPTCADHGQLEARMYVAESRAAAKAVAAARQTAAAPLAAPTPVAAPAPAPVAAPQGNIVPMATKDGAVLFTAVQLRHPEVSRAALAKVRAGSVGPSFGPAAAPAITGTKAARSRKH